MLMLSTSRRKYSAWSTPNSPARAMNARMSFGRQPPPNPKPALRNRLPIRASYPRASANIVTSAPVASHTSAIALMKDTLVARNAFADPLTNSDVARSVTRNGTPAPSISAYTSRRTPSAFPGRSRSIPRTNRSGLKVSAIACPSRRNSGFQATSTEPPAGAVARSRSPRAAAVPTGTVDFPTISEGFRNNGANMSITE